MSGLRHLSTRIGNILFAFCTAIAIISLFNVAKAQGLDEVEASRIIVESRNTFEKFEGFLWGLTLSPEGNQFIYGKKDQSDSYIIIRNTNSGNLYQKTEVEGDAKAFGWSNNSNKVALCYEHQEDQHRYAIFDTKTEEIIKLPVSCDQHDDILWPDNNYLYSFPKKGGTNIDNIKKLNLQSLDRESVNGPSKIVEDIMSSSRYSNQSETSYLKTCPDSNLKLCVISKIRDYRRVLGTANSEVKMPVFDEYVVSPNFATLILSSHVGGNSWMHLIKLGARSESFLYYRLNTTPLGWPRSERPKKFQEALDKKFTVYGRVYSPNINPLNDKTTGPNVSDMKGEVQVIITSRGDYVARVRVAREDIEAGDVVSKLWADRPNSNYPFEIGQSETWLIVGKNIANTNQVDLSGIDSKNENLNRSTHSSPKLDAGRINRMWDSGEYNKINSYVKHYLFNGGDPDARFDDNNIANITLLMVASDLRILDTVKDLLRANANVNAETNDGTTALHLASFRGNADVVRLLLNEEADPNKLARESTVSPLEIACGSTHSKSNCAQTKKLLKQAGGQR